MDTIGLKLRIEIFKELESRNKYNSPKGHWILARDKNIWERHLHDQRFLFWADREKIAKKCRRKLTITTYRHRLIDQDNLSTKALLDAMKRQEFIVDDSPKWIDLGPVKQISIGKDGRDKTIIEIEDVQL